MSPTSAESSEFLIQVFQVGFWICLGVAVAGLILAIVMFVRFDIRRIWSIRSGRQMKRSVQEIEQRGRSGGQIHKMEKRKGTQKTDSDQTAIQSTVAEQPPGKKTQWQPSPEPVIRSSETDILEENQDTDVLAVENTEILSGDTEILIGETEMLAQPGQVELPAGETQMLAGDENPDQRETKEAQFETVQLTMQDSEELDQAETEILSVEHQEAKPGNLVFAGPEPTAEKVPEQFIITQAEIIIHTQEVIP